jgi:pimeloyl-ACP methyl ester carboxylesterase
VVGALPQAELVIADGAGHVPTITRPQWVADQILAKFN